MSADERELDSWDGFVAYIRNAHPEAVIHADLPRVRFSFDHRGRSELVFAWGHQSPTGAPWLGLAVWMGPHTLFRKRAALVANRRIPAGGLALLRDSMLLAQTLPLRRLRVAHVEETLAVLGDTVALLNESARPDAPESAPFAYLFTTKMAAVTP